MTRTKTFTAGAVAIVALGLLVPTQAAYAVPQSVTGTVTLSGGLVAGTEVGWLDPFSGATGETVTGADGSYSLVVPDGHPFVLYAGIDHATTGRWLPLGGEDFVGVFVGVEGADYMYQSLTPFTTATTVTITLSKPGSIVGKAAALKNQRVRLQSLDGVEIARVRASATGRYEFSGLVPGRYRVTAFRVLQAYEEYRSKVLAVAPGETTRLSPKLTRTGTVSGVVTVAGKPAEGVVVSAAVGTENGTSTLR